MTTILNPQAMQKVLTHSKEYERAIGLLNKRWDPDEQPIFRNVLQSADVFRKCPENFIKSFFRLKQIYMNF